MFADFSCTRCRRALRARGCYRDGAVRCPGCDAMLDAVPGPTALVAMDPPSGPEVRAALPPTLARTRTGRALLPWLLLAPAVVSLAVLARAGYGVLWPGVGAGLGVLCLILGQRGRWPLPARLAAPLSLALLGHGLALAGPLLSRDAPVNLPAAPHPHSTMTSASISIGIASTASRTEPLPATTPSPFAVYPLARPDLQYVTRVDDLLALAVAPGPEDRAALATTASGSLQFFSYPQFRPQATYQLKGPAYRIALDVRRGLLWAAVCAPDALRANNRGDAPSGRADLHLYDLGPVRRGLLPDGSRLTPRLILRLQADVRELLLSADSRRLFYLAANADGTHVGRIDAEQGSVEDTLPLPPRTHALCLSPDGRTLYVASDALLVLDPDTLRLRLRVELRQADVSSVAADDEGCVYLGERGPWPQLTRIDLRGPVPEVHRWSARLPGRIYLKLSTDQYRLYVSTSAAVSDRLESLIVRGHNWKTPPPIAVACADERGPVRGEFFLTPDGQFLVNRWGKVYRLASR